MGPAACSDRLSANDSVPGCDAHDGEKRVARSQPPAMVDRHRKVVDHQIGERDGPAEHGVNRGRHRHLEVNPPVPTEPVPRSERGHDRTFHRNARTRRSREHQQGKDNQESHPAHCTDRRIPRLDGYLEQGTRDEGRGTMDQGRWTMDDGRWTMDDGPGTRDQGPGTRDQGPGTRDQGPGTRDQGRGSEFMPPTTTLRPRENRQD